MNRMSWVYIVDDDRGAGQSTRWLLESVQLNVEIFESAAEFLGRFDESMSGCVLLDIRMPHMSGLELQERLVAVGCRLPIIFLTGHGDLPACVRAFRTGAFDFLQKPVNDQLLIESVQAAINHEQELRLREEREQLKHGATTLEPTVHDRLSQLTERELEVMTYLLDGHALKHVSATLGISFQTAAKHRAKVLEKTGVSNEVELLRLIGGLQDTRTLLSLC